MTKYRFYITQTNEFILDIEAADADQAEQFFDDYITDDFTLEASAIKVENVIALED